MTCNSTTSRSDQQLDAHYNVFQSYALSHAAPTLRTSISANFFPTICKPVGNLMFSSSIAGTKPTGIVKAGCPLPRKDQYRSSPKLELTIYC